MLWTLPIGGSKHSRRSCFLLLQVTLVREHCQGPNAMLWTLPAGGYDPRKSASFLAAAQAELSEEVCHPSQLCIPLR